MSNGKRNRARGFGFERELVRRGKERGLDCRRAWGSNGQSLGESESVDVILGEFRVQAKRKKTLANFLKIPAGCDIVAIREDRGPTLIVMPLELFLDQVTKQC